MNILKKMFKRRKWILYLYYNGILIKKLKVNKDEEPTKNSYIINVWFKKQLFKSNKVNIIVRPVVLLNNNEDKKKTYWGVILEEGIKI